MKLRNPDYNFETCDRLSRLNSASDKETFYWNIDARRVPKIWASQLCNEFQNTDDGVVLTVTGESTLWTFDSSTRISLAFAHKILTSDSLMTSHRRSCSICRSRSLIILWPHHNRRSLSSGLSVCCKAGPSAFLSQQSSNLCPGRQMKGQIKSAASDICSNQPWEVETCCLSVRRIQTPSRSDCQKKQPCFHHIWVTFFIL